MVKSFCLIAKKKLKEDQSFEIKTELLLLIIKLKRLL